MMPLESQFKCRYVELPSGCWRWIGNIDCHGYGRIKSGGKSHKAHRLSWQLHKGDIPLGLCVCHICDHTWCVNPEHLFLGTYGENTLDMFSKGRANPPKGDHHWSRRCPEKVRRGFKPEYVLRGEDHPMSKLTSSDVQTIRGLKNSGLAGGNVAAQFGVSRTTVGKIWRGERWKHMVSAT